MEHDAHAEASSHAVPPPEDATVDDWARDDAEPMSVESSATPPEVAAVDSGADTPPAPSASAAVAGEGVKEIQSSLQSLELKTNEDAHVVEDDVEETKRHLNVVFIGHVDAGKSTTGGQILFLSGQVDDRTIQKYEKEAKDKSRESCFNHAYDSFAYSFHVFRERLLKLVGPTLRQNTQDSLSWMHRYLFLLYVAYMLLMQGHKSYVPNMISGASQADIGVLVISARKGEFETGYERGGQTREHVLLAKTLGVAKLVVVINKMDEPTVKWSKERYDEIEAKMVPFLKSSGYNVKKDVQFLPISGLVGTNMKTRMDKSICSWWDGPCLFEVLDRIVVPLRDPKGSVRMPIIDKYKDMGTVAMGKIESGTIREGDSLLVMPNKSHVKVIGLNLDESKVRRAGPAENVRVKLSGVEEEDVMAGFVLSSVANPVGAVSEFIAQLQILELLDNAIFTAGYKAVLHIHSVVEECEIVELIEEIGMKKKKEEDPKKKKPKRKPLFVKNGAIVVCRIQVNNLICIEKFSDFPQLGRFTLRTEGKTVAVGKVVDIPPAGSPTF
ncbi:Translation elongation factor EF1A/initiation factor IF2gamma family protein [Zea mays]|uniref:Translation elongation factor EF1A/initiation factor IF2gamma family protein n=2 Tax=Zea mays TaxID=4577 RepID=A0A1D6J4Q6_MAIZE|nr:Translation elongation factor EF1A/initiation factor IF2gamma family protein [Zea mays]